MLKSDWDFGEKVPQPGDWARSSLVRNGGIGK